MKCVSVYKLNIFPNYIYKIICFYRWLIRCLPGYFIKLNVTNFQIEENSDEILLYDATTNENNIIGEITSLGEIETSTSELLVVFKSDCHVTDKGFEIVVEIIKQPTEPNRKLTTEPEYLYSVTPRAGTWFQCKRMCEEKGGNLISNSLNSEMGLKKFVFSLCVEIFYLKFKTCS